MDVLSNWAFWIEVAIGYGELFLDWWVIVLGGHRQVCSCLSMLKLFFQKLYGFFCNPSKVTNLCKWNWWANGVAILSSLFGLVRGQGVLFLRFLLLS